MAKGKVAVAMSGGVDSSVAAALLVYDDYEVIGLTMKLFAHETVKDSRYSERGCCNISAILRAESVCKTLGIPHYSLDLVSEFQKFVIDDFIDEYMAGRTPNPCIRCNTYLKWGHLFQKMRKLECKFIATGHYARIQPINDEYHLLRAENDEKDQSYALWGIPRDKLSQTLLPLGHLKKTEVRQIAARLGLKSAQTPESQEICFIPDNDYGRFLKLTRPEFFDNLMNGDLIEETEDTAIHVGTHAGYPFYTVGQRRGLGGGFNEAHYVLRLEPSTNSVIIGTREKLLKSRFVVDQVNWLIDPPSEAIRINVQTRYRSEAAPAKIILDSATDGNTAIVDYDNPIEAIAPGQSAVFYQDDRVIGGGRIIEVN